MTAAQIAKKVFNYNGEVPVIFSFVKANTSDWVVFGDYPGVIALEGHLYTGALETTLTYGTAQVNNGGTAYSATSTSIVISTGAITRVPPYYILTTGNEIMMVLSETAADNAASTLTVKRGCLGTTATATGLVNTNVLYIMNIIYWGQATSGLIIGKFTPMPEQPSASLFGTTGA